LPAALICYAAAFRHAHAGAVFRCCFAAAISPAITLLLFVFADATLRFRRYAADAARVISIARHAALTPRLRADTPLFSLLLLLPCFGHYAAAAAIFPFSPPIFARRHYCRHFRCRFERSFQRIIFFSCLL
jgi:hypothetical protein